MSVTNVLEEIMQLTGGPARVPGEDGISDALPANGQHGEQSLEDGSETIFKEKGIDKCKRVRPFVFKRCQNKMCKTYGKLV